MVWIIPRIYCLDSFLISVCSDFSNDYITKPFDKAELLARVHTHLCLADLWKIEIENRKNLRLLNNMLPLHISKQLKGGKVCILCKFCLEYF